MTCGRLTFSLVVMMTLAASEPAASDTLLKDGQAVNLVFTTGSASRTKGSQGMGKFRQGFDEAGVTFGPAKVLKHTATELRFRGKRDDCTLKVDRTVICKSGSKGTWR